MSRLARRGLGAAAGVLADRRLGEPRVEPHPVAAFGTVMAAVEDRLWADRHGPGVVHALAGVGIGAVAGHLVASTPLATYLAVAGHGLADAARAVEARLVAGDLAGARALLPALAGRDPSLLDEAGLARAVVESVAENTVDAVVAPALWGALLGGPGVLAHRAVNTMDAMVGHRSGRYRRYGTASARLDDAMAWVPARVTAGLVAAVRPGSARAVLRAVRHDAPAHPSPNAGVAEAAFAAALGLRLGGPLTYGSRPEVRPGLGDGRPPVTADIDAAVRLADHVGLALVAALATPALAALAGRARPGRTVLCRPRRDRPGPVDDERKDQGWGRRPGRQSRGAAS
ncbi:MAG: CobD/CbiB family cobalamin biosynthesis protein [Acidimicrobiia bacterium]